MWREKSWRNKGASLTCHSSHAIYNICIVVYYKYTLRGLHSAPYKAVLVDASCHYFCIYKRVVSPSSCSRYGVNPYIILRHVKFASCYLSRVLQFELVHWNQHTSGIGICLYKINQHCVSFQLLYIRLNLYLKMNTNRGNCEVFAITLFPKRTVRTLLIHTIYCSSIFLMAY